MILNALIAINIGRKGHLFFPFPGHSRTHSPRAAPTAIMCKFLKILLVFLLFPIIIFLCLLGIVLFIIISPFYLIGKVFLVIFHSISIGINILFSSTSVVVRLDAAVFGSGTVSFVKL